MAWVRIHDQALTHPKFTGLVKLSQPFPLWVWGLSYCQTHLTDGVIAAGALPREGRRAAVELVARGLWDLVPGGWKVHDYLDWNDARALVNDRKASAKKRKDAWIEKRQSERRSGHVPELVLNALAGTDNQTKPNQTEPKKSKNKKEPSATEPPNPQAREFLLWFQSEYKTRRHGADYLVKWDRDTPLVKAMLKATTFDRLQNLARVMLSDKCEEKFIVETDRGIGILSTKFNWLSDRLAAFEAARVKSA